MKPIKSSDPRKPAILAALKAKANCRKVTMVAETATHYMGSAMWGIPMPSGKTEADREIEYIDGVRNVRVAKETVTA